MTPHPISTTPSIQDKADNECPLQKLKLQSKIDRDSEQLRSFADLAAIYQAGVHYEIIHRPVHYSRVLVGAWHGGHIEPGSDILADLIAGDSMHFYSFRALQPGGERHPLRITSIRFDEPRLISLARQSELVVGIHCCPTAGRIHRIFVGGGAPHSIKNDLISILREEDFNAGIDRLFPGMHHKNPCNLGNKPGLQIEVSQSYMDWLLNNPEHLGRLAQTISRYTRGITRA
jgi:phage replication-related protein YjqB (UPF0714/DUF867 family)